MITRYRLAIPVIVTLALIGIVLVGAPKAISAGDFTGPLSHAEQLIAGQDPLAQPPLNDRQIPYPLTASTLVIPLIWMPRLLFSALVTGCLGAALWLLIQEFASDSPWWSIILLIAYVPMIFNLQLIQWAPLLLLAV